MCPEGSLRPSGRNLGAGTVGSTASRQLIALDVGRGCVVDLFGDGIDHVLHSLLAITEAVEIIARVRTLKLVENYEISEL